MTPHKRRRLKAKRTPWIKSRYSRIARARQSLMRAIIFGQGLSQINAIRFSTAPTKLDKIEKAFCMSDAYVSTIEAVSRVPLYGSKTQ